MMVMVLSLDRLRDSYLSAGMKTLSKKEHELLEKELENTFVVQEHRSKKHHFDLRIEKNGKYLSWALPKGIPKKIGQARLAIKQPDHKLEWGIFSGEIKPGYYGAGKIEVIDTGKLEKRHEGKNGYSFKANGKYLKGFFALFKIGERDGREEWLLKKID